MVCRWFSRCDDFLGLLFCVFFSAALWVVFTCTTAFGFSWRASSYGLGVLEWLGDLRVQWLVLVRPKDLDKLSLWPTSGFLLVKQRSN